MPDYSNLSKMYVIGAYNEDDSLESWRTYFYKITDVISSAKVPMIFSGLSAHVQPQLTFAFLFLVEPDSAESIYDSLVEADKGSPHFLTIDVIDPRPQDDGNTI